VVAEGRLGVVLASVLAAGCQLPVQIALAGRRLCAVLNNGRSICFGAAERLSAEFGQPERLYQGATSDDDGFVAVGGVLESLAAGLSHTCVRLDTGNVRCWGFGVAGQLGYASINDVGDDEAPLEAGNVNIGAPVVQLALGDSHSCALLQTGRVRCWGSAGFGRLGYGHGFDIGDNETPADAGDVDLGGTAIWIDAGAEHTCAVLSDGTVRCWGAGARGVLGGQHAQRG
jgi:alpha-tubulin suppressor-like RCC1 family protein